MEEMDILKINNDDETLLDKKKYCHLITFFKLWHSQGSCLKNFTIFTYQLNIFKIELNK